MDASHQGARSRRRKGTPARGRRGVRRSFTLDEQALRRLDHYCVETRRHPADVIAELINRHLGRYVVSDRGERPGEPVPARSRDEERERTGEGPALGVVA